MKGLWAIIQFSSRVKSLLNLCFLNHQCNSKVHFIMWYSNNFVLCENRISPLSSYDWNHIFYLINKQALVIFKLVKYFIAFFTSITVTLFTLEMCKHLRATQRKDQSSFMQRLQGLKHYNPNIRLDSTGPDGDCPTIYCKITRGRYSATNTVSLWATSKTGTKTR